jgi:hypothetical protein
VDQGDLEVDGSVAPSRGRLTPARALLLALGAVIAGVALSLLIDSSPAHAADGDGAGSGAALSPLVSATSSVTGSASASVRDGVAVTLAAALDQGVPLVQRTVDAAGESVSSTVPISAPLVAPVISSVDATFTAARRLAAPAVGALLQLANSAAMHDQWRPSPALTHPASAAQTGSAVAGIANAARGSVTDGTAPDPVLTSATGSPLTTLWVVSVAIALLLLAARRRLDDDALPVSPVFDTDTSPA